MTDKQRLASVRRAKEALRKTTEGYTPNGVHWRAAFKHLDALEDDLTSKVPALGPVWPGGPSMLELDLTHITSGMSDPYPAFDGPFGAGKAMLAPEPLTVTRQSSARRRDGRPNGKAFYATGVSGIKYWFAHIDEAPAVGTVFRKGQQVGKVSANHEQPHGHVGVDARALIGKVLDHHTNYTHGAEPVGRQLAKALEA